MQQPVIGQIIVFMLGVGFVGLLLLLKHVLGKTKFARAVDYAIVVVHAIEQMYGKQISNEEKKKKAVEALMKKFKLSQKDAEFIIEAAVFVMNKLDDILMLLKKDDLEGIQKELEQLMAIEKETDK